MNTETNVTENAEQPQKQITRWGKVKQFFADLAKPIEISPGSDNWASDPNRDVHDSYWKYYGGMRHIDWI